MSEMEQPDTSTVGEVKIKFFLDWAAEKATMAENIALQANLVRFAADDEWWAEHPAHY